VVSAPPASTSGRTFATGSPAYFPPKKGQMPTGIKGDPKKGHALLRAGAKGPCTGCHVIPDVTVWPAGSVGPDLRAIGSRGISDDFLYQIIYDPRIIYGNDTPMAPFGASGIWTPEEIVHAVAYLQSLKGDPPGKPEKVTDDKQWDPRTREIVRPAYGDALDVTASPGHGAGGEHRGADVEQGRPERPVVRRLPRRARARRMASARSARSSRWSAWGSAIRSGSRSTGA
jgi:hypothetical protein